MWIIAEHLRVRDEIARMVRERLESRVAPVFGLDLASFLRMPDKIEHDGYTLDNFVLDGHILRCRVTVTDPVLIAELQRTAKGT